MYNFQYFSSFCRLIHSKMSVVHTSKLAFFCRLCDDKIVGKSYDKSYIEETIKILYKTNEINDFSMDTKATHADKVCQSCYAKCNRIKTKYKEHLSKLKKNRQSEIEFPFITTAEIPENIDNCHICSNDAFCVICTADVEADIMVEPSPSKKIKLDEEPAVSPSDKITKKGKSLQKPMAGRMSLKFGLNKGY